MSTGTTGTPSAATTGMDPGPVARALQDIAAENKLRQKDFVGELSQYTVSRYWTGTRRRMEPETERKFTTVLEAYDVPGNALRRFRRACAAARRSKPGREPKMSSLDQRILHDRLWVFQQQDDAYKWIERYIEPHTVEQCTLVQFSCTSARSLLGTVLRKNARVTL